MGVIKIKQGDQWVKLPNYGVKAFPEAPVDNKTYGRKNSSWVEFKGGDDKIYLNDNYKTESRKLIFSYTFTNFLVNCDDFSILENATNEDYEEILDCTIQEFSRIITTEVDAETTVIFPAKMEESDTTYVSSLNASIYQFMKYGDSYILYIKINELNLILSIQYVEDNFSIYVSKLEPLTTPSADDHASEFFSVFGFYPFFLSMRSGGAFRWLSPYYASVKLHYYWLKPSFFTLTSESTDAEIKEALGSGSASELWRGFKHFGNFGTFESEYDNSNMRIINSEFISFTNSYRLMITYADLYNADRNTTVNIHIDCDKATSTFSISYYKKTESPLVYTHYREPVDTDGKDGDVWIQYTE